MTARTTKALTFAAAAAVTSVFFINLCATIFRCGCVSLWTGADAHCNVHSASARHCPWCSYGVAASTIPYFVIVAIQAAISFRTGPPSAARLVAALAAFPATGAILAAAYGIAAGYWVH